MMPIFLKNQRKVPYFSEPPTGLAFEKIPPISAKDEARILNVYFTEINKNFGLSLDCNPDCTRSADPMAVAGSGRVILIGASHMHRTSAGVAAAGGEVIDLAAPGWAPGKESCQKLAECLTGLQPNSKDTVVLDIWSNSSVMGTDEFGLPCRAVKQHGTYHIVGHLQAAPRTVFQKGCEDARQILAAAGAAAKILVAPFPRYIRERCCPDPLHITNYGTEEYEEEFAKVIDTVESVLVTSDCSLLKLDDVFSNADTNLSGLCTADGAPVWSAGDPVHLSKTAYGELGAYIAAAAGGCDPGRQLFRPRLESIIPTNAAGSIGKGVRGNFSTPLWVTGQAGRMGPGRSWGRGRGRGRPGQYVWIRGTTDRGGSGDPFRSLRGGNVHKPPRERFQRGYLSRSGGGGGRPGRARW
jgi:hypothetical protein